MSPRASKTANMPPRAWQTAKLPPRTPGRSFQDDMTVFIHLKILPTRRSITNSSSWTFRLLTAAALLATTDASFFDIMGAAGALNGLQGGCGGGGGGRSVPSPSYNKIVLDDKRELDGISFFLKDSNGEFKELPREYAYITSMLVDTGDAFHKYPDWGVWRFRRWWLPGTQWLRNFLYKKIYSPLGTRKVKITELYVDSMESHHKVIAFLHKEVDLCYAKFSVRSRHTYKVKSGPSRGLPYAPKWQQFVKKYPSDELFKVANAVGPQLPPPPETELPLASEDSEPSYRSSRTAEPNASSPPVDPRQEEDQGNPPASNSWSSTPKRRTQKRKRKAPHKKSRRRSKAHRASRGPVSFKSKSQLFRRAGQETQLEREDLRSHNASSPPDDPSQEEDQGNPPASNSWAWLNPNNWSTSVKAVAIVAIGTLAWWYSPREETILPQRASKAKPTMEVVSENWFPTTSAVLATGAAVAGAAYLVKKLAKPTSSGETESPDASAEESRAKHASRALDKPDPASEKKSFFQKHYLIIILGVAGVAIAAGVLYLVYCLCSSPAKDPEDELDDCPV